MGALRLYIWAHMRVVFRAAGAGGTAVRPVPTRRRRRHWQCDTGSAAWSVSLFASSASRPPPRWCARNKKSSGRPIPPRKRRCCSVSRFLETTHPPNSTGYQAQNEEDTTRRKRKDAFAEKTARVQPAHRPLSPSLCGPRPQRRTGNHGFVVAHGWAPNRERHITPTFLSGSCQSLYPLRIGRA